MHHYLPYASKLTARVERRSTVIVEILLQKGDSNILLLEINRLFELRDAGDHTNRFKIVHA
jgi:hypothetical protein